MRNIRLGTIDYCEDLCSKLRKCTGFSPSLFRHVANNFNSTVSLRIYWRTVRPIRDNKPFKNPRSKSHKNRSKYTRTKIKN